MESYVINIRYNILFMTGKGKLQADQYLRAKFERFSISERQPLPALAVASKLAMENLVSCIRKVSEIIKLFRILRRF